MSSLQQTKSGYRIQFRLQAKLKQISLKGVTRRQAEKIQRSIDHLVAAKTHNTEVDDWSSPVFQKKHCQASFVPEMNPKHTH